MDRLPPTILTPHGRRLEWPSVRLGLLSGIDSCWLLLGSVWHDDAQRVQNLLGSVACARTCGWCGMWLHLHPQCCYSSFLFSTKRGLANGITASGSGLGELVPVELHD